MWFAPSPTLLGRLLIAATLLFGPSEYLYVWCRLTPRWYAGELAPRLGLLISGGAIDAVMGGSIEFTIETQGRL